MAARILFVTGKGGTGKSVVSASLARAAARRGDDVLLLRHPDSFRATCGLAAPGAAGTGSLEEKPLDADAELGAFLARVLRVGFLARRLMDSRTFSALAAAAPGLRDLVCMVAIAREASRRDGLVVVDAPATGHGLALLLAPAQVLALADSGPAAREARRARDLLGDPSRSCIVVLATPEEIPVVEAVSLHGALREAGITSVRVVVNAAWPARCSPQQEDALLETLACPDTIRHIRRARRHAMSVRGLETRVGPCPLLGFSFAPDGELQQEQADSLLAELVPGAA